MQKIEHPTKEMFEQAGRNAGLYYDWYVFSTPMREHEAYVKNYAPNVEKFLSHVPAGGTVVDLGCGMGVASAYFWKKHYRQIGIENSRLSLFLARQFFPQLDLRFGNVRDVANLGPVDSVYERLAIMYLPQPELLRLFADIFATLRPGGVFQCTFEKGAEDESGFYLYNISDSMTDISGKEFQLTIPVWVNYYELPGLRGQLQEAGFAVLDTWESQEPETSKRPLLTVLCQKPA